MIVAGRGADYATRPGLAKQEAPLRGELAIVTDIR